MKFHQVAIYAINHVKTVGLYKDMGFMNWSYDIATLAMHGVRGDKILTAKMAFNYEYFKDGKELEVITYVGDSHHHISGRVAQCVPFISHMSTYIDDALDAATFYCDKFGVRLVHRFDTYNHVNPKIAGKLRFREAIIDTRHLFGYDIKFIQRLTEGPWELNVE